MSVSFFLAELPAESELALYEAVLLALLRASDLGDEVPASEGCIDSLFVAARECGVRVLGSSALHSEVLDSLVDAGVGFGVGEVDVPATLGVLAESGVLELGPSALSRLSAMGFVDGP